MLTANATLYIDLGNSQTRLLVACGKNRSDVEVIDNKFAALPTGWTPPESYADSHDSMVFEYNGNRYAQGRMASREFQAYLLSPTALMSKSDSPVTPLTLRASFIKAYSVLSKMMGTAISSLDISWTVVVLVPPLQLSDKSAMTGLIEEVTRISVEFPKVQEHPIQIDKVVVRPEGISAFFSIVFNDDRTVREGYENLRKSSVLIVDIGAGTTDVCVLEDFSAIDDTKDTFNIGGNNVSQQVNKSLKAAGLNIREERVQEGVLTGEVLDGSETINVREFVDAAKTKIASALAQHIRQSFEANLFSPRDLQYLIVVGGGAARYAGSSLGAKIETHLRQFAPKIKLVDLPIDGNVRHLNIMGAALTA